MALVSCVAASLLTIIDGGCLYNKLTGKRYLQLLHPIRINYRTGTSSGGETALTRRITIQQNKEAFTPGFFLRHIYRGGEYVIVYCFAPHNLTGICQNAGNITYIIQTRILEELDENIGEGATL